MLLRLVGAAGSRALSWPFSKLWRCGGCAGSGGAVWSSVRVGGIARQVSREAPSTGFRRRGGGSAGRRSDVIFLRLGGAQPLPDFRCRLLQCLPSADPSTLYGLQYLLAVFLGDGSHIKGGLYSLKRRSS